MQCLWGDTLAKEKERDIIIIDRSAPRVAIQITEISVDVKKKTRRRQSVAHLTVTNLSGEEAKRIIVRAIEKAGGR
jgi:GTP-sensing pleiotropic transcriptional regulator CodY